MARQQSAGRSSARRYSEVEKAQAVGQFHRSVLELAPVIMTGTVHRPMELADRE